MPAERSPAGRVPRLRRVVQFLLLAAVLAVAAAGVTAWQLGYRAYVVHTGSMTPLYRPGDLVIDRPVRGAVRPGQVITFRHAAAPVEVVTHRVVDVGPAGIHTKGDANRSADAWTIQPRHVVGVAASRIPYAGYVAVFLQRPSGIAAVGAGALTALLLWTLFFPGEAGVEPPRRRHRRPATATG